MRYSGTMYNKNDVALHVRGIRRFLVTGKVPGGHVCYSASNFWGMRNVRILLLTGERRANEPGSWIRL